MIPIFFTLIFISLLAALIFLLKDKKGQSRTAQALTWRIGLSLTLFCLLLLGFHFGWLHPHGL